MLMEIRNCIIELQNKKYDNKPETNIRKDSLLAKKFGG